MELEKAIENFVTEHLKAPSHFLVGVHIKGKEGGRKKVEVLIDADEGIDIESIVHYNRLLSDYLDELNPFNTPYDLEVSSPGVDYPLQTTRQYTKNIGRLIAFTIETSDTILGKLLEVSEDKVKIEAIINKKRKPEQKYEMELPLASIKKAIVQITF